MGGQPGVAMHTKQQGRREEVQIHLRVVVVFVVGDVVEEDVAPALRGSPQSSGDAMAMSSCFAIRRAPSGRPHHHHRRTTKGKRKCIKEEVFEAGGAAAHGRPSSLGEFVGDTCELTRGPATPRRAPTPPSTPFGGCATVAPRGPGGWR